MFLRDPIHSAAAAGVATPQGKLKWRFDTALPLFASPAVVDGRLYLGSGDNRIVALDADTGELIWEHPVRGPVDSSPAVAGDSVFIGLRDGRVLSLHKDSGELQWEFQTGGIFATSPVALEGILYMGSGRRQALHAGRADGAGFAGRIRLTATSRPTRLSTTILWR